MLGGLTREVSWRDVTEGTPPAVMWVLAAQSPFENERNAVCRPAYWDGRDFLDPAGHFPMQTVTHWMAFPELPKAEEMRRVFRALLGDMETP